MAMELFFSDLRGIPRSNIEGVDKVFAQINRRLVRMEGATLAGLIKAAAVIHNETEQGDVQTPKDLGNLRHSWFVVTSSGNIQSGGGTSHSTEGAGEGFNGPNAGRFAASHSSMLAEMKAKAESLSKANDGPFLIMGYSVDYALWVHENIGADFTKHGNPKADAKWFQAALEKHRDNIVEIVASNARIR